MRHFFIVFFMLILCLGFSTSVDAFGKSSKQKLSKIQALRAELSLGDTQFSDVTTQNEDAKEHFLLGVTFLESFMYDLAIQQFQAAQKLDPGFAMSYWGEAMATKHPIWHFENLPVAKAALAKYEANKDGRVLTDKEQGYLQAVKEMVEQPTLEARDTAYLKQMQELNKRYPNDPNIASFYTLAVLGLAADFPENEYSKNQLAEGKEEIDALIKTFPNHPGVAHYYLHYHDTSDRAYAAQALPTAVTALTVMKSSSHVTHMAAHIYRRLEQWDNYIVANEVSINAANKLCKKFNIQPLYKCDAENKYHSMEWLQEGYLKKKRYKEAMRLLQDMATVAGRDSGLLYQEWFYKMWARQVLETQNWKMWQIKIKPIAKPGDDLYLASYAECGALLASGFLSIHQRQPIDKILKRLDVIVEMTSHLADPYVNQTCKISMLEVKAEQARVAGDLGKASDFGYQARAVARQQVSTELTPSIPFLSAEQYCQQHFK
jgi:hypothetical protein